MRLIIFLLLFSSANLFAQSFYVFGGDKFSQNYSQFFIDGIFSQKLIWTKKNNLQIGIGLEKNKNGYEVFFQKFSTSCIFRLNGDPFFLGKSTGFGDFLLQNNFYAASFQYTRFFSSKKSNLGLHIGTSLLQTGTKNISAFKEGLSTITVNNQTYNLYYLDKTIGSFNEPAILLNAGLTFNYNLTNRVFVKIHSGFSLGINPFTVRKINFTIVGPKFTDNYIGFAYTKGDHFYESVSIGYRFTTEKKKEKISKKSKTKKPLTD
jgi:hypothetical protein